MKLNSHIIKFLLGLCVIILVIGLLSYLEPEDIISKLGIENTYLAIFAFAIFGGVSAFSAAGFYGTLFYFAHSGMNPFILAGFSAFGVLIGDFIFWYIGVEGRKLIKNEENTYAIRLSGWLKQKPRWFVPIIIYAYTGLSPFPGDILMLALAFTGYRPRDIIIPTFFGNYTLALIITSSAYYF